MTLPGIPLDFIHSKGFKKMIKVEDGILKINNSFAVNLKEIEYIGLDKKDKEFHTLVAIDREGLQTIVMLDVDTYPDFEKDYEEIELEWGTINAVGM